MTTQLKDGLLNYMGQGTKDGIPVALFELSAASAGVSGAFNSASTNLPDDIRSKQLAHGAKVAIRSRNMTSLTLAQIEARKAQLQEHAGQLPQTMAALDRGITALKNAVPAQTATRQPRMIMT